VKRLLHKPILRQILESGAMAELLEKIAFKNTIRAVGAKNPLNLVYKNLFPLLRAVCGIKYPDSFKFVLKLTSHIT
jgi:hypothetical protein